jgi:hypothetical protein
VTRRKEGLENKWKNKVFFFSKILRKVIEVGVSFFFFFLFFHFKQYYVVVTHDIWWFFIRKWPCSFFWKFCQPCSLFKKFCQPCSVPIFSIIRKKQTIQFLHYYQKDAWLIWRKVFFCSFSVVWLLSVIIWKSEYQILQA